MKQTWKMHIKGEELIVLKSIQQKYYGVECWKKASKSRGLVMVWEKELVEQIMFRCLRGRDEIGGPRKVQSEKALQEGTRFKMHVFSQTWFIVAVKRSCESQNQIP